MSGPAKYLMDTEEENLEMLLSRCRMIGYAQSKAEVLSLVQRIFGKVEESMCLYCMVGGHPSSGAILSL